MWNLTSVSGSRGTLYIAGKNYCSLAQLKDNINL